MALPIEEWPLNQEVNSCEDLPEQIKHTFVLTGAVQSEVPIKIERFSNYIRLIRVTARVLQLKKSGPNYSLRKLGRSLGSEHLEDAKSFWVKVAHDSITEELNRAISGQGSYRKLNVKQIDGLYIAAGRVEAWNELTYNKKDLLILPGNHRYSKLYAAYIHNQAHRGVSADVAKIRTEYWIFAILRLVKNIRFNSVKCRRYDGKLEEQVMAPLPPERLKPAPVWHYTALDLFGPFPNTI